MTLLIDNGTSTSGTHVWQGGGGLYEVAATWSGSTITLQRKNASGAWVDVGSDGILTADGMAEFNLPGGDIRIEVTGGPPSAVYASVTENQSRTR